MFGSGLMKMQLVIDEINDSAASALQAVKLLALYLSGGEQKVCSSSVTWPLNFFVSVMSTHWEHFSALLLSCENGRHSFIWQDSVILALSHAMVLTQLTFTGEGFV